MALPNDMQRIADAIGGASTSDPTLTNASKTVARQLIRRTYELEKAAADGAAATATTSDTSPCVRMRVAGRVLGAYYTPHATLTSNDTTYATMNVDKRDGAGGAATSIATFTTKTSGSGGSGDFAAATTVTAAVTAANARYTKGSILCFSITKASTGVVVPAGTWTIDVEEEDIDAYPV